jgi:hypothetical protein
MHKFIALGSAAVLFGISSLSGVIPAAAAPGNHAQQDQYIGNYCSSNPTAGQCDDWQTNHSHWTSNQYQGFYRGHRNDAGFGGSVAAGLFGFAVGAAVASSVNNGNDDSAHVRACESAYHSYTVGTDSYLGYDGARHQCEL